MRCHRAMGATPPASPEAVRREQFAAALAEKNANPARAAYGGSSSCKKIRSVKKSTPPELMGNLKLRAGRKLLQDKCAERGAAHNEVARQVGLYKALKSGGGTARVRQGKEDVIITGWVQLGCSEIEIPKLLQVGKPRIRRVRQGRAAKPVGGRANDPAVYTQADKDIVVDGLKTASGGRFFRAPSGARDAVPAQAAPVLFPTVPR